MWLDVYIFRFINNCAELNNVFDIFWIFAATFLMPLMFVLIIPAALSIKKLADEHWWKLIVRAGIAAGLAYVIREIFKIFFFRLRPFAALPNVHQLISMNSNESSFPSGHASVVFALAFAVFFIDREWGWSFIIMAIIVAVGRIFVGVHYPTDIIGGFLVGLVAAWLIHVTEKMELGKIRRRL